MADFGAKIKLHVDPSGSATFRREIKTLVDSVADNLKLKIKHIDVQFSSAEIQSAVNKVQSELTNGLRNVKVSLGGMGLEQIMPSALKGQLAVLDDIQKKLSTVYRGALSGKSTITDSTALDNITTRYAEWKAAVESVRASNQTMSAERMQQLSREGIQIQQIISAIQEAQSATVSAGKTEESQLKKTLNLYKTISAYSRRNPRVMESKNYGDSMNALLGRFLSGEALEQKELDSIANEFLSISMRAKQAGLEGKGALTMIADAYKKFGGWSLVTKSMSKAVELVRKMFTTVVELDGAMTELKKVTDLTEASYSNVFDRSIERAKALGSTVKDTITATADFARLGYSVSDAEKLSDAAIIYKNVGDGITDISAASESIISTMKAFGIEAENSMQIVDKFNEVGNNFAISSKGVGDALQRSASALAEAGNTLDESIGLAVGMNTVLQNPEKVGTILKTSAMYLRAAKTEAEAAGEATDGMASSVSALRSELLTLTKGKVDIMVDDTTFKSTVQIYRELAAVWNEISDIDAANILELIGGKRNATGIAAVLTNFQEVEKAIASAGNSEGSALAENETYVDSLKGKIAELKATFEEFSSVFMSTNFAGFWISFAQGILSVVGGMQKLQLLIPVIVTGLSLLTIKRKSMKAANSNMMISGLVGSLEKEKGLTIQLSAAISSLTIKERERFLQSVMASEEIDEGLKEQIRDTLVLKGATEATNKEQKKMTMGQKALGFLKTNWLSVAMDVASLAYSAYQAYQQRIQEMHQRAADIRSEWDDFSNAYAENIEKIKGYESELPSLMGGVDEYGNNISLTTEQYERYRDLIAEIVGISPELIEGYDAEGNAIVSKTNLLERLIDAQKKAYNDELWDRYSGKNLSDQYDDIRKQKEVVDWNKYRKGLATYDDSADARGSADIAESLNISVEELAKNISKYRTEYIELFSNGDEDRAAGIGRLFDIATRGLEERYEEYQKHNAQFIKDMQIVPQLSDNYNNLSGAAKSALTGVIDQLDILSVESKGKLESIRNQIIEITDEFSGMGGDAFDTFTMSNNLNKFFDDGSVTLYTYSTLMDEVSSQHKELIGDMADMLVGRQDLAKALGIEDGNLDNVLDKEEIVAGLEIKFDINKQDVLQNLNGIINDAKSYVTSDDSLNAIDLSASFGSFNKKQINEINMLFGEVSDNFDKLSQARGIEVLADTVNAINDVSGNKLNDILEGLDRTDSKSVKEYNDAIEKLFEKLRNDENFDGLESSLNVLEDVLGDASLAIEDFHSKYTNFLSLAESGGVSTGESAISKAVETLKTGLKEGTVNTQLFNEALNLVFGDERPKNLEDALNKIGSLFASGEDSSGKIFSQLGKYSENGTINFKKMRDELQLSDAAFAALKDKVRDLGILTANTKDMNLIGDGLGISNKDIINFESQARELVSGFSDGTDSIEEYMESVDALARSFGVTGDELETFRRNMRAMATGRYSAGAAGTGRDGTITAFLGIDGTVGQEIERKIADNFDVYQKALEQGGDKIDYSKIFDTDDMMDDIEDSLRSTGEFYEAEIQTMMSELNNRVGKIRVDAAIEAEIKNLNLNTGDADSLKEILSNAYNSETQTFDIDKVVAKVKDLEFTKTDGHAISGNQILKQLGANMNADGTYDIGSGILSIQTTTATQNLSDVIEKAENLQVELEKIKNGDWKIDLEQTQIDTAKSKVSDIKRILTSITSNPWNVNFNIGTPTLPTLSPPGGVHELNGNAFSGGTIGARKDEIALGGEVGREIVVDARRGTWRTIGDRGAEFFKVNKGDIIFNAKQTQELLKYGRTSGYGRAYLGGNAYAGALPSDYLSYVSGKGGSSSSSGSRSKSSKANEESLKELKEVFDDIIRNIEHEIFIAEKRGASYAEIAELYRTIQSSSNEYANKFRSMGEDDKTSEYIQDMQKQWWDAQDAVVEMFEKDRDSIENRINLSKSWLDDAAAKGDTASIKDNTDNIVANYERMQNSVLEQAEYYRKLGYSETSEEIAELNQLWWDYEKDRTEAISEGYDKERELLENSTELSKTQIEAAALEGDNVKVTALTNSIISNYKAMQESVHKEAEYYRSLGYDESREEISKLSQLWWDYQKGITDALDTSYTAVIENTKDVFDSVRDAFDTLKEAANEYADTGKVSVELISSISEMGVEYLGYLKDENGQLVLNEKSLNKLISAKTEQLAVDTAYAYVMQLKNALESDNTKELDRLTTNLYSASDATWELVYANLALLNLDQDHYDKALDNIGALRSLADQAVRDINKSSKNNNQSLSDSKDALEQILDLTMDLIKYEKEQQIEALEEQADRYREIIELKKESLQASKDENDYNKEVAKKVAEIADIQSRINQLSLDDSREAQAERKSLEEELYELQTDLADYQADYSLEKQTEALDKELEAYEEAKDDEKKIIEDSISSTEKLYQLALERLEGNLTTLKGDILAWNYEAGSSIQSEIIDSWDVAIEKIKEYGSYLDALNAVESAIDTSDKSENKVIGDSKHYGDPSSIITEMRSNSLKWRTVSEEEQGDLHSANIRLASKLSKIYGKKVVPKDGLWYIEGQEKPIYEITGEEVWRDENGVWWYGGTRLYDTKNKYHEGGIVGDNDTIKDNEVLALLEDGEVVLDSQKKNSLYKYMDIASYMMEKFGTTIKNFTSYSSMTPRLLENEIKSISGDSSSLLSNISENNPTYVIESLEVNTPIQVLQKLDEDDIIEHSKTIGEISSRCIQDAFSKKGMRPAASLI